MGINKYIITCLNLVIFSMIFGIGSMMPNESYTKQHDHNTIAYTLLLTEQNKPTEELSALLALLKVEHDTTLSSIVRETQKQWLRQPEKERWQVEEVCGSLKDKILLHAINLGITQEVNPSQMHYTYGIIFGAALTRTRTRLQFLINQWKKGVRFERVIFLGSERPLDPAIESEAKLLDPNNGEIAFKQGWEKPAKLPKTEYEMMVFVYEQSEMPEDFAKLPVDFVNSPMRNENGIIRRPTTGDTVVDWLAASPAHGDCLFISNQPFVGYQDSVMRTYMPEDFGIMETCGSAAQENPQNQNLLFLDTLARFLYQEKIRRDKKNH